MYNYASTYALNFIHSNPFFTPNKILLPLVWLSKSVIPNFGFLDYPMVRNLIMLGFDLNLGYVTRSQPYILVPMLGFFKFVCVYIYIDQ